MKAVILAGGLGTRLSEETSVRPKPMVEIGGYPILWHIMKIYSAHGVNDFVICLGYKGHVIKDFFLNYKMHRADITVDLGADSTEIHSCRAENWRVTLVETGPLTETGGRLKRVMPYVADEEAFFLTYGDGVGDVDITAALNLHREEGRLATVTAAQPAGRFGALATKGNQVLSFREKPDGDGGWINGGFFVLSPKVADYIDGDDTAWERGPLDRLAKDGQLSVYRHGGFWQPMDTLRDRTVLEGMWNSGAAPWRIWSE
jgi:glucose-1-phosphate cytidylyltransferase